jgi:hypothetical protein
MNVCVHHGDTMDIRNENLYLGLKFFFGTKKNKKNMPTPGIERGPCDRQVDALPTEPWWQKQKKSEPWC